MAWSSPRTWVTSEVVTAAQLNAHVRDNFNVTTPATVTTKGDSVWGTGANAISRLGVVADGGVIVADASETPGVAWTTDTLIDPDVPRITFPSGTGGTIPSGSVGIGRDNAYLHLEAPNGIFLEVDNDGSDPGNDALYLGQDGVFDDVFVCFASGLFCLKDTANINMTIGLTINQGVADNEIIALKSSDVAHSFTSETEADTFGRFQKQVSSEGGLIIDGWTEGSSGGLVLAANNGAGIITKGNSSLGGIALVSFLINGSARGSHNANENLVIVRDNATTVWIVDKEGDTHRDGTDNPFDEHDDVQLIRALDHELSPARIIRNEFDAFLKYNRGDLIEAGILSEGNFINESQLLRLHSGAFWQMSEKISRLETRLDSAMALLGAGG